jgi:hypothetical protein
MDFIGKMLFPRQAEWERERNLKMTLWVVLFAVIFATIVAGLILYTGFNHPH